MFYMLAYPKFLIIYSLFESYIFLCIAGGCNNASINSNVCLSILELLLYFFLLKCLDIQSFEDR
jgi:hypothetical protein